MAEIQKTIEFLERFGFSSVRDRCNDYAKTNTIHFLQLNDKKFLIVNYHPSGLGGFDVWISEYERASDIGIRPATQYESLMQSLHIPRDSAFLLSLINQ